MKSNAWWRERLKNSSKVFIKEWLAPRIRRHKDMGKTGDTLGPTGPQNQNNHALLKFCFRNVTKRIHLIHDFNQNRKKKTKQLPLGSDVLLTKHKGFFFRKLLHMECWAYQRNIHVRCKSNHTVKLWFLSVYAGKGRPKKTIAGLIRAAFDGPRTPAACSSPWTWKWGLAPAAQYLINHCLTLASGAVVTRVLSSIQARPLMWCNRWVSADKVGWVHFTARSAFL